MLIKFDESLLVWASLKGLPFTNYLRDLSASAPSPHTLDFHNFMAIFWAYPATKTAAANASGKRKKKLEKVDSNDLNMLKYVKMK